MTDQAIAVPRRTSAVERYLAAETRLWQHYGLAAAGAVRRDRPAASEASRARGWERERQCCSSTAPSVRDAWPSLVAGMPGFRCLVLDRPGWGLSTPVDFRAAGIGQFVADLLARSCSIRSTSTGSTWSAGRSATCGRSAWPNTIRRASVGSCSSAAGRSSPMSACRVSSGCWPRRSARSSSGCRSTGIGCCPSCATAGTRPAWRTGACPTSSSTWRLAPANDTPRCVTSATWSAASSAGRVGGRASCSTRASSAASKQPTLLVYGTADPTGSVEIWRRVTDSLPDGELQVIDRAPATIRGSRTRRASPRGCRASWRDRRAIRRRSRRPMPGGRAPRGRCS